MEVCWLNLPMHQDGDLESLCRSVACSACCIRAVGMRFDSRPSSLPACSGRRELIYTYDGLYSVETAQMEQGQDGHQICK